MCVYISRRLTIREVRVFCCSKWRCNYGRYLPCAGRKLRQGTHTAFELSLKYLEIQATNTAKRASSHDPFAALHVHTEHMHKARRAIAHAARLVPPTRLFVVLIVRVVGVGVVLNVI